MLEGLNAIFTRISEIESRFETLRAQSAQQQTSASQTDAFSQMLTDRSAAIAAGNSDNSTSYDGYISEAADEYELPDSLLKAMIKVESNFNPRAVSSKGATGLMQLMPETAQQMGVQDSTDPRQNIFGGARFLRSLLNRFDGNLVQALAAYNAGPQAVLQYNGVPPYDETRNYIESVMRNYLEFS